MRDHFLCTFTVVDVTDTVILRLVITANQYQRDFLRHNPWRQPRLPRYQQSDILRGNGSLDAGSSAAMHKTGFNNVNKNSFGR